MFNKKKSYCLTISLLLIMQLLSGCAVDSIGNANEPIQQPIETVTSAEPDAPNSEVPPPTSPTPIPISQNITGTLEIAFLDVGQGDSTYFILPNGESMLIDAGESSESQSIIQSIKDNNDKGVLDYIISTHPHSGHIGGMAANPRPLVNISAFRGTISSNL